MVFPGPREKTDRVLTFRDVRVTRDGKPILRAVDLELKRGEIHALIGGSAAVKSCLCSLAAGEILPDSGEAEAFDGAPPERNKRRMIARGILKAPKIAQLFPHLSVAQNLTAGFAGGWLENWRPWRKKYIRIRDWLERYEITLPDRQPLAFVPREYWLFIQLLNLLFRRPKLLILDETMELLPPEQRSRVWPIIQDQSGNGMATLWATESLDDAVSYSTRLTAFHEQGILFTDATRGLDHLSLVRLCYGRRMRDADATLEQFHQTLCYTEAALRDLPTAVIVVDNDLSTRFVNSRAAALFNASEAGMLNKKLADFGRADSVQLAGIVQDAIFEAEDTGGDVEWRSPGPTSPIQKTRWRT